MLIVIYAKVSIMLSVANKPPYAESHYAECHYAEWHYAECRDAVINAAKL
jgi:hypothetical protein